MFDSKDLTALKRNYEQLLVISSSRSAWWSGAEQGCWEGSNTAETTPVTPVTKQVPSGSPAVEGKAEVYREGWSTRYPGTDLARAGLEAGFKAGAAPECHNLDVRYPHGHETPGGTCHIAAGNPATVSQRTRGIVSSHPQLLARLAGRGLTAGTRFATPTTLLLHVVKH